MAHLLAWLKDKAELFINNNLARQLRDFLLLIALVVDSAVSPKVKERFLIIASFAFTPS